ncbi:hypothetical protein N9N67_01155 [Bacteriovoracaceae bacterium]|nr:hypothetical protein [Bacteriovoracaceae bacterium]
MSKFIFLLTLLFTLSGFCRVSLDIQYKNFKTNKKITFNKKVELFLDEVRTLIIPKTNHILEVKLTERIPQSLIGDEVFGDEVLVDVKVFELIKEERVLITSPKILTIYGKDATMEMSTEVKKKKQPQKLLMSLKLSPKKI